MPAFYMWMLVLSYYHALKVAFAFKTFRATVPANDPDYGLELAIRRRRTKSLFGEALVRSRLISNLYSDKQIHLAGNITTSKATENLPPINVLTVNTKEGIKTDSENKTDNERTAIEPIEPDNNITEVAQSFIVPNRLPSDLGTYEDWFGNEILVPRNTDRINEQFGLMLLRISAFLRGEKNGQNQLLESPSMLAVAPLQTQKLNCPTLTDEATDTPPLVASKKSNIASYLRDYPDIFMKKNDSQLQHRLDSIRVVQSQIEGKTAERAHTEQRQVVRINSGENVSRDLHRPLSEKKTAAKQSKLRHQKRLETDKKTEKKNDIRNGTEKNMDYGETSKRRNSTETLKADSPATVSPSTSLTSIVERMKSSLSKVKSSRKEKNKSTTSSQNGSTTTSSEDSREKNV